MRIGILLAAFLLSIPEVWCQETPQVTRINRSEHGGMAQNWDIARDCNGLIYVANSAGVLIYNGFNWQLVTLPNKQIARTLSLGKDCKVYVGGYEVFGNIDVSTRSVPFYNDLADESIQGSLQEIWAMFEYNDQMVMQSFSDVFVYDYEKIKAYKPPTNIMLGDRVNDACLIPSVGNYIYKFSNGAFSIDSVTMQVPENAKIAAITSSKDGNLIIATQDKGLFVKVNNRLTAVNNPLNNQLKSEIVNRMTKLSTGHYAIGTILNGLYIVNDNFEIVHHINKRKGLSNNTVLSFFELDNGDLMVGLDKGLDIIRLSDASRYYYDKEGQLGTVFTSIYYQGMLYLGTNQGVFKKLKNGEFELIAGSQGQVWFFYQHRNNLICGHNDGIFLLNNEKFEPLTDITGGIFIDALGQDTMLIATYSGIVKMIYDGAAYRVSRIENGNVKLERFMISDNVLIGVHLLHGLYVLKFSDDFNNIEETNVISEIDGERVTSDIHLIKDGEQMLVGIGDDYYQYIDNSFDLVSFTQEEKRKFKKTFHLTSGIPAHFMTFYNTINTSDSHKSKEFILGVDEGYVVIPADYTQIDKSTNIEKIVLDYTLANGVLKNSIVELRPNESDVVFQLRKEQIGNPFSGKYQLEGWEENWFPIPEDGRIAVRNLDDGDYVFKIKDQTNKEKEIIEFSVLPTWYESWPGFLLYIAFAGMIIFILQKQSEKTLNDQMENLQKEKQKEIEEERIKARNDKLRKEVKHKSKLLANRTMTLIQKNKMLNELKTRIETMGKDEEDLNKAKRKILHLIDRNISTDEDWEIFERNFAEVHEDFLNTLKNRHENITASDLRLAAYIKMNLSSKEIAPLLNISVRSVENKRYRLRKKMNISSDVSLSDYLLKF